MAKFNTAGTRAAVTSPIRSTASPTGTTHEGAPGYARDAKSELFLLAVSNMVGEATFYESASDRDSRFTALVHQVATEDAGWMLEFLRWLRGDANMRSASLVAAAEAVKARLAAQTQDGNAHNAVTNRSLISAVLQRADEPGEMLAYWLSRHGRKIPIAVKRGITDAIVRLYDERALLKYDADSHAFRFGDVIELVQPATHAPSIRGTWRHELFGHAIDRRHGRDKPIPESLEMLQNRALLMAAKPEMRRAILDPVTLRSAGMTWESLAGWLQGPMDAAAWQAVIPSMGYMALLRNLRNFDEAGVPDDVAARVAATLADPERVARSRQLPMRFLSAHRAAPSLRWAYQLEQALGHSLANIPTLPGRTLILVDTSSSMENPFSKDGKLMRWDAAALFGIALGQRCTTAHVVSFSSAARYWGDAAGAATKAFPLERGESLLRSVERWKSGGYFLGGGTDTALALRKEYTGHDRVVIVTDEQAARDSVEVNDAIPRHIPMYTWNLAGYEHGHGPSGTGNRHTFGGLTDAAFRMIPLLEAGRNGRWPWQ